METANGRNKQWNQIKGITQTETEKEPRHSKLSGSQLPTPYYSHQKDREWNENKVGDPIWITSK